jgi:hypothetical protein
MAKVGCKIELLPRRTNYSYYNYYQIVNNVDVKRTL